MSLFRYLAVAVLSIILVGISQNAFAGGSGVIRLELPDAATVGKGSAFVGQADRPSAVYYNPAGITQIGKELSAGVTFLQPGIDVKLPNGDNVQSRRDTFVFPHVYFTTPVVQDKFYLGIGEGSNYGSGGHWAADSPSSFTRYSMIHSKFENKDIMFVGAYKINDQLSFGVGVDDDDSKIEKQKKLLQAGTGDDGNSQLKAKDNAWGYRLAALYKVNNKHQFGLTYRSAIHHEYEGKLYMDNLNTYPTFGPIAFGFPGGYQNVFGGTSFETKALYKVTLPQSVALGYSFKPTDRWTFNLDIEWLDWSNTKQSTINFPDATAGQMAVLSTNNPQSRDWKSVWSESLGLEYAATNKLRLRGGYVHHQTPIGNSTFDTAFPDNNSHSFATGLGYDLNSKLSIDVAYVGVLYERRKVTNNVDSGFSANLTGNYEQFVNIGTITLTYKY